MVPPTTASCHPNERTEFVAPKRTLILGRKTSATLNPSPKWPLYLAVLIAMMIIGGVATTWRKEQTTERTKTNKAI